MSKMKKYFKEYDLIDWCIVGIIIIFIFFLYQHPDIRHTGGSSIAYLNGHIWDFYDYNKIQPTIGGNAYMPTMYIIFAIWNIPIRLLKLIVVPTMDVSLYVSMWYKVLTTLFYVGTTYYMYKICRGLNVNKKMALFAAFLFFSNPIAIYSQFIFGQYDILTTFFITLGIYFYIKNDDWKFVIAFAIAVTCKYFALLFFIPMLLHKEKNVVEILKKCAGVASLFLIETVFYIHSPAFRDGVFGFGATGYIFDLVLDENHTQVSVVLFTWVALCAYAYFSENNGNNWLIYYLNIVTFISFGLSFWHPQWLLMAVPTWVLGNVISKKRDIFMLLECLLTTFYIVFAMNVWPGALDQGLFAGGVLRKFIDVSKLGANYKMCDFFHIKDMELLFSCFVAILFVYTFFKYPKLTQNIDDIDENYSKGINRLRYLYGTLIFIVPSFFCLVYNYVKPTVVYEVTNSNIQWTGGMAAGSCYEQYFTLEAEKITEIQFYTTTYGRRNDCNLNVEIYDDRQKEIANSTVSADGFDDCAYNAVKFDDVKVEPNKQYMMKVYCTNVLDSLDNSISLSTTAEDCNEANYLLNSDGNKENENLVFKIFGE